MPIVQRELLRESRRLSHFVFRTVFAAALSGMIVWTLAHFRISGRVAQRDYARLGAELFGMWTLCMRYALPVFAILRAANMAEERRSRSLPLLRSTGMADGEIVFGYFLSVMGRVVILIALTLPIIANIRSLGGFPMEHLLFTIASTLARTAMATALGLLVAARCERMGGAAVMALLLYFGAGKIIMALYGSIARAFGKPHPHSTFLFGMILPHVFVAGVSFRLATHFLGLPPTRWLPQIKRFLSAIDRKFLTFSQGSFVLWKSGLGPCKGNPVLWRERAVSLIGQTDHLIRICYLSLMAITIIPMFLVLFGFIESAIVVIILGMVLIASIIAFICLVVAPATTFSREYQRRSAAMLALTSLAPRQIVLGKYRHMMRPLAGIGLIMAAMIGMTTFLNEDYAGLHGAVYAFCWPLLLPIVTAQIMYVCMGTRSVSKAIFVGSGVIGLWTLAIVWLPTLNLGAYQQNTAGRGVLLASAASILILLSLWERLFAHGVVAVATLLIVLFIQPNSVAGKTAWSFIAILGPAMMVFLLFRAGTRQTGVAFAVCLGLLVLSQALPPFVFLMVALSALGWSGMQLADSEPINRLILSTLLVFPLMYVVGVALWNFLEEGERFYHTSSRLPFGSAVGLTLTLGLFACFALLKAGCMQIEPLLRQNA